MCVRLSLINVLLSVAELLRRLHGVSLACHSDVTFQVTFDPCADVCRVSQHCPLVGELMT